MVVKVQLRDNAMCVSRPEAGLIPLEWVCAVEGSSTHSLKCDDQKKVDWYNESDLIQSMNPLGRVTIKP